MNGAEPPAELSSTEIRQSISELARLDSPAEAPRCCLGSILMTTEEALKLIARLAREIQYQAMGNKESERVAIARAAALIEKVATGDELEAADQEFADDFLAQSQ